MAMPIAIPIESALGDGPPLEVVVMALAEIAETLARLHALDVAHRDIKPSNLYRYHDAWVISRLGAGGHTWRRTANGWGQGSWPTPLHRPRNDPAA